MITATARKKSFGALLAAALFLALLPALPAYAVTPTATASLDVDDREVLAGQANTYDLTVTNTGGDGGLLGLEGADPNINSVVVAAPGFFADLGTGAGAPDGWEVRELSNNRVQFFTEGDGIAPGGSLDFDIPSQIGNFGYEEGVIFSVQVSSDGGREQDAADPASNGALESLARILNITNLVVDQPEGAADLSVTDGQGNVLIDATIENLSTVDLSVEPVLTDSSGSPDIQFELQDGDGTAVPITAGTSDTVTFEATFSGTGSTTVNAEAQGFAGGELRGTAPADSDLGLPFEVQAATNLDFSSISTDLVGAGEQTFTVNFNKSGTPPATLETITATLTNGGTTKTDTAEPVEVQGGGATVPVEFTFTFTEEDAAGFYNADFSFAGVDANDATIDLTEDVTSLLEFDPFAPIFDNVEIALPDGSQVDGETAAAGNGRQVQVTGDVLDNDQPCGACSVQLQLVADGQEIGPQRDVANNGGSFDTSFTVESLPDAVQDGSLHAQLIAFDEAGNGPTNGSSSSVPFDTRPATLEVSQPLTGGLAERIGEEEDRQVIDVLFDEGLDVPFSTSATQWAVDGHSVSGASLMSAQDVDTDETLWFVRLSLNGELLENETPTVTYDRDGGLGGSSGVTGSNTRLFDRVDLTTPNGAKEAIDNIAPSLPILSEVDGRVTQFDDDEEKRFFANGDDTELTIAEVAPGSVVEIRLVEQDGETSVLDRVENTSAEGSGNRTIETTVNLGNTGRLVTLELQAFDSGDKDSLLGEHEVRIDPAAPTALLAEVTGDNEVTVTADDVIPYGADAATEWSVMVADDRGNEFLIQAEIVSPPEGSEGDPQSLDAAAFLNLDKRVLSLDDSAYDVNEMTVLRVEYETQFDEPYTDRAGNVLQSTAVFDF